MTVLISGDFTLTTRKSSTVLYSHRNTLICMCFTCILQHEAAGQTPYLLPKLVETMADPQNGELQLLGGTLGLRALLKCEKYARHVAF